MFENHRLLMNRLTIAELKNIRKSEDHVEFKEGEHGNVSYSGADKQQPKGRRRLCDCALQ